MIGFLIVALVFLVMLSLAHRYRKGGLPAEMMALKRFFADWKVNGFLIFAVFVWLLVEWFRS